MYFKNWETTIYCDGYPVEEYCARIEDSTTVSCWIPSEAGKKFEVHWRNELDELASADCYMDGRSMGGSPTQSWRRGRRWGVRTGYDTFAPYQFKHLVVTDDDDLADPACDVRDLGVIEVRVCRVEFEYRRHLRPFQPRDYPERGPIHERSKKAGTHCVSLGDGVRCPPHRPSEWKTVYLDSQERPYIRFIFRYRPKALLQAEGIMPRDSHPYDAYHYAGAGPSTSRPYHSSVKQEVPPTPNPALAVMNLAARQPSPRLQNTGPTPAWLSTIDLDADVIDLTGED